ncbi:MAG: tetratricopeptide repeat protein [Planctomycetota bacterium]|jgi:hypothetical protein
MEKLHRYTEAVTWLDRSSRLPDGEFTWKGPLRALYVLDALASEEDIDTLVEEGSSKEIREKALLTRAIRFLRRRDFEGARKVLDRFVVEYPSSRFGKEVEKRRQVLSKTLIPQCVAAREKERADEALYALGRHFYHDLLSLYNPAWEGSRVNYLSYEVNCLGRTHAFTHPEYFESHNNYLCAAVYFDMLWREHPDSPLRPKALYSAGTCYFKAPTLNQFSLFRLTRAELITESKARYELLLKDHPNHHLAQSAKKMIEVLRNTPGTSWR